MIVLGYVFKPVKRKHLQWELNGVRIEQLPGPQGIDIFQVSFNGWSYTSKDPELALTSLSVELEREVGELLG
jgi:hypothetical protein